MELFEKKDLGTALVLDAMPEGWKRIEGAATAPNGYYWAENGKSRFSKEFQHALIREEAQEMKE